MKRHPRIFPLFSIRLCPAFSQPSPGYIQDKNSKVKPFSKKTVENIFTTALEKYSSLDNEKKFEINTLALQIKALLLSDPQGTTVQHSSGAVSLDISSQRAVSSQAKNRKMPIKEIKRRKQMKSISGKNDLLLWLYDLCGRLANHSLYLVLRCARHRVQYCG